MRIDPLQLRREVRVGLVTGPKTVRGEWTRGNRQGWDDIPEKNVKLFVPSDKPYLWPLVESGEAKAIKWKHHGITTFLYRGHRITSLRGTMEDLSTQGKLDALFEWARFHRTHGANIGTLAGTSYSLFRSTLKDRIVEIGDRPPTESFMLGARIQSQTAGEYPSVDLWDISSAYAYTLGNVELPRVWKRYPGPGWNDLEPTAFVLASVYIPMSWWGPLPTPNLRGKPQAPIVSAATMHELSFPTNTKVVGLWTAEELKMAGEEGADIDVIESWIGFGSLTPFLDWWQLVEEGKKTLPSDAVRLLKWSSNTLWGRFAARGAETVVWFDKRKMMRQRVTRKIRPQSMTLAALVAARMRARVFKEALKVFGPTVIQVHTDGVIVPSGIHIEPNGGEAGHWRVKERADRLYLLGPQHYMVEKDGIPSYIMAGVPDKVKREVFERAYERVKARTGE